MNFSDNILYLNIGMQKVKTTSNAIFGGLLAACSECVVFDHA